MAKSQSGLPDNFDLSVTASDLAGPASLPGYLDEDPVVAFAKMQQAKKVEEGSNRVRNAPQLPKPIALTERSAEKVAPAAGPQAAPVQPVVDSPVAMKSIRPAIDRKRFQINLDVESERMLEEILGLLSSQSSENSIKISELFQALLLILHNAKGEIALGSLPTRGRWGSATAKAFPVNLAQALREAIIAHEGESGGNPFAKIVGG